VTGPGRSGARPPASVWALVAILLLALALRLKGIHDPILDHPGWRQGDTAAIARNFATLDYNPLHPQTDYDGPPPNYVELELQIVPFVAATLYKIFGVHEIFGRLISLGFSLLNVALLYAFAGWLFGRPGRRNEVAGLGAALTFALYPGSIYYGRTFMPDTAMVCLATAAVYAAARWIVDDGGTWGSRLRTAGIVTALAILAKPVAAVVLVPIFAALLARGGPRVLLRPATWAFAALALAPYLAYDAYLRSIAEWHWASAIASKHVVPELRAAFTSPAALGAKFGLFGNALGMLGSTMLGPAGLALLVLALVTPVRARSRAILWGWLGGAVLYAFVVVTVEKVDYYLYLVLPLAALWSGGLAARVADFVAERPGARVLAAIAGCATLAAIGWTGHVALRPYYRYNPDVYRRAVALDARLAPGALVVMAHYDPSVLYYIRRKGWEEDPSLWTPFDEESAIRKGARYFIAIEDRRLRRNVELCHWLERFPLLDPNAAWPVYVTDPARVLPGAEARWKAFRKLEAAGASQPCPLRNLKAPTEGAAANLRTPPPNRRFPAPNPTRPNAGS
jgi:hypothetical protein